MAILQSDALHLPLADESIDAVVCDPPYGLEFMGKEWDSFRTDIPTSGRHRGENAGAHGARTGGVYGTGESKAKVVYGGVGKRPSTQTCTECGKRDQFNQPHSPCGKGTWRRVTLDPHSAPPAMLAFGEWSRQWAREAYRVLKPGGHLLAFGGTRTSHRLACGIEDAGFEMRDAITWLYGQGFPKSLDVGKAIDKENGKHTRDLSVFGAYVRERRVARGWSLRQLDEVMGTNTAASWWEGRKSGVQPPGVEAYHRLKDVLGMSDMFDELIEWCEAEREVVAQRQSTDRRADGSVIGLGHSGDNDVTAPATDAAKQWDGWGTALKPSFEPVIVARKPLGERTVAGNVQMWGTGALNIDGCRVGTTVETWPTSRSGPVEGARFCAVGPTVTEKTGAAPAGRWPTNVVLTHTPDCVEVGTRKVKTGTAVKRNGVTSEGVTGWGVAAVGTPDVSHAGADGLETIPAYECAAGCPVAELDAQSGTLTSHGVVQPFIGKRKDAEVYGQYAQSFVAPTATTSGGASRFFPTFRYQAKADSDQRPSYYTHSCTCEAAWPSHVKATGEATTVAARSSSTSTSGNVYTEESQAGTTYTTLTETSSTTTPPTLHSSTRSRTSASTRDASGETASGGSHAQSALTLNPSPSIIGTSVPRVGHSTDDADLATSHKWSKTSVCGRCGAPARRESHSTVKPLELMRWLVRLVTPPGGLVLDMFAGSGTTAEAALLEGFRCIAIERDASYLPLIRHRLNRRLDPVTYLRDTHATEDTLFGDLA